jgi:hypothetical protein
MEPLTFEGSLGDLEELPVSRSLTAPQIRTAAAGFVNTAMYVYPAR